MLPSPFRVSCQGLTRVCSIFARHRHQRVRYARHVLADLHQRKGLFQVPVLGRLPEGAPRPHQVQGNRGPRLPVVRQTPRHQENLARPPRNDRHRQRNQKRHRTGLCIQDGNDLLERRQRAENLQVSVKIIVFFLNFLNFDSFFCLVKK